VVATGSIAASLELTPLVEERLPGIARVIAVPGSDAFEAVSALGALPVDMSHAGGTERLIDTVFQALGLERRLPVPSLASDEDRALEYA